MLRSAPGARISLRAFSAAIPFTPSVCYNSNDVLENCAFFARAAASKKRSPCSTRLRHLTRNKPMPSSFACANHNCLRIGQTLHRHMLAGYPDNPPDRYVSNHLSGYPQHGRANESFSLFASMLAHYRPTEFAYASVLTSCKIDCGRQVHALALKTSFDGYVYVANALISMYANACDYDVYNDDKDEAWMVFQAMKFRNVVT